MLITEHTYATSESTSTVSQHGVTPNSKHWKLLFVLLVTALDEHKFDTQSVDSLH
jgi:hypothetical protein